MTNHHDWLRPVFDVKSALPQCTLLPLSQGDNYRHWADGTTGREMDNRRNSFLPSCSLRTTVAIVSSRRLTGSEADKLGRPPGGLLKHGLLLAGLFSLWDGQHHFPVQGQDDVLPLRTATMQ
ncbi:hypothetical protein ACOMHN_017457 [Nucella lapillus]